MSALIQFVQNYQDLSTDRGFQFKFFCDKCGNGYMTRFQTSTFGMAESALHVAADLFGGVFNSIGNSAYEVQRAVGGKAHDAALEAAVQECKQQFHQCTRCGKWVCPEVCWNDAAGLCEGCAPNFQEEMAAEQAHMKAWAVRDQLYEKAHKEDYVSKIDMSPGAVQRAPGPATAAEDRCTACGTAIGHDVRFCPQCGAARPARGCPACGAPIQPNTRFCGQCGGKLA
jgi:hypothetical protein